MTGPSSSPRGEHTPRPGVTWATTTVGWTGEHVIDDDQPPPPPQPGHPQGSSEEAPPMTTGPPPCAYTGRCDWDDDADTCPCLDPEPEPPDRPVVDVPVGHYL